MDLKKFSLLYIIYTIFLASAALLLKQFYPAALVSQFWLIFSFIAGLTFIAYILADLGIRKNPETGVVAILGSITLKMLFAMSFVLIYSLKQAETNMTFALNFFSLYLLFTLFEILSLLRNLRHQNK